ncbi:hypothetical protein EBU24_02340 [bacterium]|nr:hypothetical protein [bacterium]
MKKYGLLFMLIAGLHISSSSLRASGTEDLGTRTIESSVIDSVKNSCRRQLNNLLPTNKHARAVVVFLLSTHGDKTLKTAAWNVFISSGKYAASWVPFSDDIFNGVKSRIPVIKDIDNKKLLMFIRSLPIIIYMLSYVDQATKRKCMIVVAQLKTNMQQKFKTHFQEPVFDLIRQFIKDNPDAFCGLFNVTQNNTTTTINNIGTVNVGSFSVDTMNVDVQHEPTTEAGKAALKRAAEKKAREEFKDQVIVPVAEDDNEDEEEASGEDSVKMQEIKDAINAADRAKKHTVVTVENSDLDALEKKPKPRTPSNQSAGQTGFLGMVRNAAFAVGQKVSGLLTEENKSDDEINDGDKK